jgi:hypothetical protein
MCIIQQETVSFENNLLNEKKLEKVKNIKIFIYI